MRPALCEDALRLGRVLAELAPREGEVHGLVALMEIQASRLGSRTDAAGAPVLLLDQDRGRWDLLLIGRGLKALDRAEALGGEPGPYRLQAEIAACHARALTAEDTDWVRIAGLYDELSIRAPSPVVELNRAVAIAEAGDVETALGVVDRLELDRYHYLHATRAELLRRLDRGDDARAAYDRALELVHSDAERRFLERKRRELPG
jgi:predicted RNA polymerase sigma factor